MLINKGLEKGKNFNNTQLTFFKVLINKMRLLLMILVINGHKFISWPEQDILISKSTFSFEISLLNTFIIIESSTYILDFKS